MPRRAPYVNSVSETEVRNLRIAALDKIIACEEPREVEACIEYARFLNTVKVHPDNYMLVMEIMNNGNHHVIESLVGDDDPVHFFDEVETSPYMIHEFLQTLYRYQPGALHPKMLKVLFGVLIRGYKEPLSGFRKYQLSREDINAVGKNLDESKGQDEEVNRQILEFLAEIGEMKNRGLGFEEEIASHAINIRNAFLDPRERLWNKIPELLVERVAYEEQSVNPGEQKAPEEA